MYKSILVVVMVLVVNMTGCTLVPYEPITQEWQARKEAWRTGEDSGACTSSRHRCVTYSHISYNTRVIGDMECRYADETLNGSNWKTKPKRIAICRTKDGATWEYLTNPPRMGWW